MCAVEINLCSHGWNPHGTVIQYAGTAQQVEQRFHKPQVIDSSPISGSNYKISQPLQN